MAGLSAPLWMGIALLRLLSVQCDEDLVSMIDRMDGLNEDIIRVQKRVTHQMESAKIVPRLELKQHIVEHVREAMVGILQGEFSEEIMRSKIITEVKQLKRGNNQLKRQLSRVLVSLENVQKEMKTIQEAVKKSLNDTNVIKECSKCFIDPEILKNVLEQCNTDTERIHLLTSPKDKEVYELNQNLVTTMKLSTTHSVTSSTTSTSVTTPLLVTPKPEEERNRIIISPFWHPDRLKFLQMNMNNGRVNTYHLRSLKFVTSLAYVSKLGKLLIGLTFPYKIISSRLDRKTFGIIRRNVRTYGMAVDEEREIIFLTTDAPRPTISRMTTRGKNFTTVTELEKYALSLAVDSQEKRIYACDGTKLFAVRYDGHYMQTLVTAKKINAVTLDITGGFLYYNDKKVMKKLTLSQNSSVDVANFSKIPWNFVFYKDTVYFSCFRSPVIGAVYMRNSIGLYTEKTLTDWKSQVICLVP